MKSNNRQAEDSQALRRVSTGVAGRSPAADRNAPQRRRPVVSPATVRILHVHGRMGRGGAEMRTVEIFRNIDRRRYQFHFCVLSGMPGELDDEVRALGGEVHMMRVSQRGFAEQFEGLLRRQLYDVVHSHLHYRSGYLMRLAARCGVPVRVAHFRSSHEQRCGTPLRRLAQRVLSPFVECYASRRVLRGWIDRYATDVLGVSKGSLSAAWSPQWQSDPRCRVVYDGLETLPFAADPDSQGVRREFALPDEDPLLIHVGRMTEAKNHPRLILMFAELLKRRPTARLLLVSRAAVTADEIANERLVRRRIDELGIGGRVIFGGERTDVPRLMKASDLLVFPSRWEGLGDVVLEACAAGTPTLCSDLPSIREISHHLSGVECLSLQKPDDEWARRAEQLADNRPLPEARQAALERFARSVFTVEECMESLRRVWLRRNPMPQDSMLVDEGIASV